MNRFKMTLIIVAFLAFISGIFVLDPIVWGKISNFRPWSLGLDLAGGSFLTYDIDLSKIESGDRDSVVKGLRDVIEKRVNLFGVSEPRVYTELSGEKQRLVVELAGITDVNQAIREIGATPLLDFREVRESASSSSGILSEKTTSTVTFIPTNLTGRYIKSAQIVLDDITRSPQISLSFNDEGATLFEEITGRNIGKPLCIFLDNRLNSVDSDCPIVQAKIAGGKAQITGRFSLNEAKSLVERFNAGALPAPITLVNQNTVSADLGKDSLEKVILAGVLGTLVVMIFMIIYYGRLGFFATLALLMYISLTLGIFKIIPITLTLSGIAGFILSIGMAVDANILIFERTREELKKGLVREMAIEEGFKRAWTSIRDSNISTMITSVVLYYFTSSFVSGFALALFLGVVMSMFSAITITRIFLKIFIKNELVKID